MKSNHDYHEVLQNKKSFDDTKLTKMRISNSQFTACTFRTTDLSESSFIKTEFLNCNFTGSNLSQCLLREASFVGCKFDLASIMFCQVKSSSWQDCVFKDVRLGETTFTNSSSFIDCSFELVDFNGLKINKELTFEESTFLDISGVKSLKKAVISAEQLVQLAPYLAIDAGITVQSLSDTLQKEAK